ncbi:unnamed protein product, partial [Effrenium voratum]
MSDAQGGSSGDGGNVPRLFGGVGVDVNQLFEDATSGDPQESSRAGVQLGPGGQQAGSSAQSVSGGQQAGAGIDVAQLVESFQQQSQRMAQVLEQLSARMTQNETEMQNRLDAITAQLAQRQANQQNVQPPAPPMAQATVNAQGQGANLLAVVELKDQQEIFQRKARCLLEWTFQLQIIRSGKAIGYRNSIMGFQTKESRLVDIVRAVESELHRFDTMIRGCPLDVGDLQIQAVTNYDLNTRVMGDVDVRLHGFVDSEAEPNEEDNLDDPGSLMTLSHQFVTSSSVNSVSSGRTFKKPDKEGSDPESGLVATVDQKLVHKRGAYEVASDYGFLGTARFFVMIVLCTGMIGTFVMDTDMDKNVRSLNNVFREVGLVGKSLEVTLDGEDLVLIDVGDMPGDSIPRPVLQGPSEIYDPEEGEFSGEPQPASVPMDVDNLITDEISAARDRFLAMEQSTRGGEWRPMVFNEQTIFQQIAPQTRCESSGVILDPNKVAESYQTEYTELSKLGVGEQISEKQAHEISDKAGTKILSSRWVVVLKTTGRVRARVVCRDYKSAGLTAFREDISSPTASLESLRLMLGSAYYSRGLLVTLDISTAFLYAELDGPAQVVLLPASVVDKVVDMVVKRLAEYYKIRETGFLVKSVEVSPDLSKFVVKDEASSAVLGKTESVIPSPDGWMGEEDTLQ